MSELTSEEEDIMLENGLDDARDIREEKKLHQELEMMDEGEYESG
jgi:hypothetical protein